MRLRYGVQLPCSKSYHPGKISQGNWEFGEKSTCAFICVPWYVRIPAVNFARLAGATLSSQGMQGKRGPSNSFARPKVI